MADTLLELVQGVQTELGLNVAPCVIRSPDNTARQLGALASRVGMMLMRAYDWSFLTREWDITVLAPLPAVGNLTLGSKLVTSVTPGVLPSLKPQFMQVFGPGVQRSTYLAGVDAVAGSVTMTQPAASSGTAVALDFSQDTYPTPDGFSRSVSRTQWDRSSQWELRGPQSPQEDQWMRSGIVATGPRRQYREQGKNYRIWPAPYAGEGTSQLSAEYITKNWCLSASFTEQPRYLADADTSLFDDDLMTMGLKYLFFRAKGFEYSGLQEDFENAASTAMAMDGGAPTIQLGRSGFPMFLSPANVQDSNFGNP